MKKKISIFIIMFIICIPLVYFLSGCTKDKELFVITFDSAGGSLVDSQSLNYGEKVKEPQIPVKDGYEFEGWYCEDEKWSFIGYTITEDITLTAKWNMLEYEINYFNNDGLFLEEYLTTYNICSNDIELPLLLKNNYEFQGWYNNPDFLGNQIDTIKTGTFGNLNLYAKFTLYEDIIIEIRTPNELYNLSQDITNLKKHIKIMNDLDMTNIQWTPLGTIETPFTGIIDGQGHSIINLNVNSTISYSGLLGYVSNANIKNLNISNIIINQSTAKESYIGSIAGKSYSSEITNCVVDCSININCTTVTEKPTLMVGGIVGTGSGLIENCYSKGYVLANLLNENPSNGQDALCVAGGIAGEFSGEIINTYTTCNISAIAKNNAYVSGYNTYVFSKASVGGIVGYSQSGIEISKSFSLSNTLSTTSTNTFDTSHQYSNVGGIIGYVDRYAQSSNISNVYVLDGQILIGNSKSSYGNEVSLSEILEYVFNNWDNSIWILSLNEKPILYYE